MDRFGRLELPTEAFGELHGAIEIGARQEGRQLLAAEPGAEIGFTQAEPQAIGSTPQRRVAGRMAVAVIDLLEVIQIDHDHGAGQAVPARQRQFSGHAGKEAATIGQPGQRIQIGQPLQLGIGMVQAEIGPGIVERQMAL